MMFGKTAFLLRTILIWCVLTVILVESARLKKDVHHMIYLNEERRPPKSHRHNSHGNHHRYKESRPKKSRKKPGGPYHKDSSSLEDSLEDNSYEEFLNHRPKSKRHHHKHTGHSSHYHKRHNDQRYHKKHHKNNYQHQSRRHNVDNHKHNEFHEIPNTSWMPMTSKEFFEKEQHQYFGGNLPNRASRYPQPTPMEITTSLPFHTTSSYYYPSLALPYNSYISQSLVQQAPLIGSVEPYKPFDYSVLEQKHQSLSTSSNLYQEQEPSSSNVVNVKQGGGKNGHSFSIVVENSRENLKNKEKGDEEKEEKNQEDEGKSETAKGKRKRVPGNSRYRSRSQY